MRYVRFVSMFLLLLPLLFSCNKELKVNADWKDVTVVYGLLDQTEDTTYIKITKAFLGEGNALQFATVPDSRTYPDKLEVILQAYSGATLMESHPCDTVTIHNKQAGDSIFYFPNQLMYYSKARLNVDYTYKLLIKNKQSGKEITAQTGLLHDFEVFYPNGVASFVVGKSFRVKWQPSKNGKRYQLVIRFCYLESLKSSPSNKTLKFADWLVFNNVKAADASSTQAFDLYYPGDVFYSVIGTKIKEDSLVDRIARKCIFIFTVGAPELDTYMEVTEPSIGLVQEKPSYTNITNGIGLFSARFMKPTDSLDVSDVTKQELKVNEHTKNLGF